MATKHTDTCLQNAAADEPIFVLRAQDKLAPDVVRYWARRAVNNSVNPAKVTEAEDLAYKMEQWAAGHTSKIPD